MSKLKIFLISAIFLLVLAIVASGYVWLRVQKALSSSAIEVIQDVAHDRTIGTKDDSSQKLETFVPSEDTPIANSLPEEGMKIDSKIITNEQKAMAEKVGIDVDSISITPEMVGCAEKKLGEGRLQEIINGTSPSVLESMSLLGCL